VENLTGNLLCGILSIKPRPLKVVSLRLHVGTRRERREKALHHIPNEPIVGGNLTCFRGDQSRKGGPEI